VFKRILVPLDGSETAENVLPTVIAEAKLHSATVVLLRAIAPLRQSLMSIPSVMSQVYEQVEVIARDYLENLVAKLGEEGVEIDLVVKHGPPAQTVLEVAQDQACDLIIIGTHGESSSLQWRFGSVADKIIRAQISIPVLVVPT